MSRAKPSEVIDVVSPSTLLLRNGWIVELSGIDIPGSYGEDISPLAVTARDILKDMLVGERVDVYQTKDRDSGRMNRMGHHLVHLSRNKDDVWAQGMLLTLGLARVKTSISNIDVAQEMLALEDKARQEKIGIWAEERFRVLNPDETEEALGEFAVVEGRIESVALKKNRIYINFGKDWRNDFTVSIAPEDKRRFSKAKLDPLGWGGKIIRVRGSIRSYNVPNMEATHPQSIEIIDKPPVDDPIGNNSEE